MNTKNIIKNAAFSTALLLSLTACEKNDGPNDDDRDSNDVEFFISTEVNAAGQVSGYLLATPDITQGTLSIKGNGLEMSGYNTWVFPTEQEIGRASCRERVGNEVVA